MLAASVILATNDLRNELGVAGAFIYGSSLFRRLELCGDVDVVVLTLGRQRLRHVALTYSGLPRISVTVVDTRTFELDLTRLTSAGFLLNKLINPLLPFIGISRIALWQIQAMTTLMVLSGQNPQNVLRWKEEQFPGWRSTHSPVCLPDASPGPPVRRRLDDLQRPAELRGHWDVYRALR
jgi:hypothetical protein